MAANRSESSEVCAIVLVNSEFDEMAHLLPLQRNKVLFPFCNKNVELERTSLIHTTIYTPTHIGALILTHIHTHIYPHTHTHTYVMSVELSK